MNNTTSEYIVNGYLDDMVVQHTVEANNHLDATVLTLSDYPDFEIWGMGLITDKDE